LMCSTIFRYLKGGSHNQVWCNRWPYQYWMDLHLSELSWHYQLIRTIHRIVLILVYPLLAIVHYHKKGMSYEKERHTKWKKTTNIISHLISFSVMCKRNLSCFMSLRDWYWWFASNSVAYACLPSPTPPKRSERDESSSSSSSSRRIDLAILPSFRRSRDSDSSWPVQKKGIGCENNNHLSNCCILIQHIKQTTEIVIFNVWVLKRST
jgi:hypothetical protein